MTNYKEGQWKLTISSRQDLVLLYWNCDRLGAWRQDQLRLVQRLRLMFLV